MDLMSFIPLITAVLVILGIIFAGTLIIALKFYKKVPQGRAMICTGQGQTRVSFSGMWVVPVFHQLEVMDISIKRLEIERTALNGLICKDNIRADIKVAFFVGVNQRQEDVLDVAKNIGTSRASNNETLYELFDALFSEALKSVGKRFEFVDLYNERKEFKEAILQTIGQDLNGYHLKDVAIDFLEQTDIKQLDPSNILDAEGIKKITDLTSRQAILANQIDREREKTIKQQDVEAEEAILEMDRQLTESKERQTREISEIKAREAAQVVSVQQEERRKAEKARIEAEEEIRVAGENMERQVIVAQKNKARTEKVEDERVEKDRQLEVIERERIVTLTNIEKEKAVEEEKKNIQDVIRERVSVQKAVVIEEERIKDTQAFAAAERDKKVALTQAEREAEELRVREVVTAQAAKEAAAHEAEQRVIEADAQMKTADKNAEARKVLAEAKAKEEATMGLAEAQVIEAKAEAVRHEGEAHAHVALKKAEAEAKAIEAKAEAMRKEGDAKAEVHAAQGTAEAKVIEDKAVAEARGLEAQADARAKMGEADASVVEKKLAAEASGIAAKGDAEAGVLKKKYQADAEGEEAKGSADAAVLAKRARAEAEGMAAKAEARAKEGEAEADVLLRRFNAEAAGIKEKAEAMKLFDDVGREHEEFKLRLEQERLLQMAQIEADRAIAREQAAVVREGLKSANIDIVGGESMFFDRIMNSVTKGKGVDRMVGSSEVLTDVKNTFFNGDSARFQESLRKFVGQFGMSSEDVKNLTISALLYKMMNQTDDTKMKGTLSQILGMAEKLGLGDKNAGMFDL
ncbi:flotillin family protein [Acanthopleuribacter pedis]|uniref:Inner membrane protein YqiK n=1 Tax=Acanthopleuribacter pedis TaxID=442870 RepID=A0A8J7QKK0_9BACT|nr:flotillin family protein [Acanthopleuribacter pedis]MBO1321650.1 hypothetical protein [Acanthopleuribacter pedis]